MAIDLKISQLSPINGATLAPPDVLPVVHSASGETRKVSIETLDERYIGVALTGLVGDVLASGGGVASATVVAVGGATAGTVADAAVNSLRALTGDVQATGPALTATVVSVGGKTAAQIATAVNLAPVAIATTLTNNQGVGADVTGLVFNKLVVKGASIAFCIERTTLSAQRYIVGTILVMHRGFSDAWSITWTSSGDEDDTLFSITAAGQVQYTTENLSGSSYSGVFRASVTNILL
jgi:hypothetical protein